MTYSLVDQLVVLRSPDDGATVEVWHYGRRRWEEASGRLARSFAEGRSIAESVAFAKVLLSTP